MQCSKKQLSKTAPKNRLPLKLQFVNVIPVKIAPPKEQYFNFDFLNKVPKNLHLLNEECIEFELRKSL